MKISHTRWGRVKIVLAYLPLAFAIAQVTTVVHAQNAPISDGTSSAPDEWLLASQGQPWWYVSKPSPSPFAFAIRTPTAAEATILDRAHALLATKPAKAFALLDGDSVVSTEYKAPANADSIFFGFSMGKTVTSMAVGQAICAGKLKLETLANDLVPELRDRPLGKAMVRDLLRMASGAADPLPNTSIWTSDQFKRWTTGNLTILESVTEERVSRSARAVFSDVKPGERFTYKSTDPMVLGLMISRATGMPYSTWVQRNVLDPMGAAQTGLIVQDRNQDGATDAGIRLRLGDWIRFAQWVKRSSKETGCFGDYVRSAIKTQISNSGTPATRKIGKFFDGYGYLTWTENSVAPATAWASGWGGQRISWNGDSDRMVVIFSNAENWMPELYELVRDWNRLGK